MAERTCTSPNCDRPLLARGLCNTCYGRARYHGNLPERVRRVCMIEGCTRKYEGSGYCKLHRDRKSRHGDPLYVGRRPAGSGHLTPRGYIMGWHPDHPLAGATGFVLEHRVVLFDAIGNGPHPCHWCGKTLTWSPELTVDHLDWDRSNNDPANLVPACAACNGARQKPKTST